MRITPAGAGKTLQLSSNIVFAPDHPRVCGENALGKTRITVAMGSPPQVRGKRFTLFDSTHNSRITPAYAGKTLTTVMGFMRGYCSTITHLPPGELPSSGAGFSFE